MRSANATSMASSPDTSINLDTLFPNLIYRAMIAKKDKQTTGLKRELALGFCLLELEESHNVEIGGDLPDEVEVCDVEGAIGSRSQGLGGQELELVGGPVEAGLREAVCGPALPVALDGRHNLEKETLMTHGLR